MKNRKIVAQVRVYKHKTENRYLRVEGDKTSLYIYESRGNTTTQKTIKNATVSVLEIERLYREIDMIQFNTALYHGHANLHLFENGHDMSISQRELKTA